MLRKKKIWLGLVLYVLHTTMTVVSLYVVIRMLKDINKLSGIEAAIATVAPIIYLFVFVCFTYLGALIYAPYPPPKKKETR